MRIGYGFNRTDLEFADANCDDLFIDAPETHRAEYFYMLAALANEDGVTLVALSLDDLPMSRERTPGNFLLEIWEPPEVEWQTGAVPDEVQDFIRPWWHSRVSIDHINRVLKRYKNVGPFNRNSLNYYLKGRGQS